MKNIKILNTGFNPDKNLSKGTSDENAFYETTSSKDCISSIIKNEQFIVDEPLYLASNIIINNIELLPKTE